MKYRFQGLLQFKDNSDPKSGVTGSMGPVLAIKEYSEAMNIQYSGACRVWNNQSYDPSYDHLILIKRYKNARVYYLFVDMGTLSLPVGIWVDKDDKPEEPVLTPIYEQQITKEMMHKHLEDMEHPVHKNMPFEKMPHPIMVFNKEGLKELFQMAWESGELEVKPAS